jgi:asparagine synthase (glutamine-hydrolysing)
MPGIAGFISQESRGGAEAQLNRMVESMCHESFYSTGKWNDESLGLHIGWVEREPSFASAMPLRNETGDRALIFSGDEFPERGIAQRLKERGHSLNPDDCSHLVHLAEEDAAFPAGLNGQFHGLLADLRNRTATLFNDRWGLHRLYYYEAEDGFYFASEAKAILAVRPELRSVDPQGLGEFITLGCVLEDRTLFRGIKVLPIASAWVFRSGSLELKGKYFSPEEWESQSPLEPEPFYQQVREVFSRNLPRYFAGPGNVGFSLTGGLDTRMILAWLKPEPGSLPCYTFAGTYRESRDVRIARKVAKVCGLTYELIPVGEEFLERFPYYAERSVYLTDGCAGVDEAANIYANQMARQIAPVRMTGNYGDQILRWQRVFKPGNPAPGLFQDDILKHAEAAKETFARVIQGHKLTVAAFRQAPWHYYGLLALESSQVSIRTPYVDNELVKLLYRAPVSALANNDLRVWLIAEGNPELSKIRTDLGFAGRGGKLIEAVNAKFHRITMHAEYLYDYGMPEQLARIDHALAKLHLERLILGVHKFAHFRVWYRNELAGYVREMLLDSRTLARPYLNRGFVEAMVKDHLDGHRNYTAEIHTVLTVEYLHRLFVD